MGMAIPFAVFGLVVIALSVFGFREKRKHQERTKNIVRPRMAA